MTSKIGEILFAGFSVANAWGGGGGGVGTPLYKLYSYMPPQRVWFLSRFGLKTGIDFAHYDLKSGMVFKGTTRAYKRISTPKQYVDVTWTR